MKLIDPPISPPNPTPQPSRLSTVCPRPHHPKHLPSTHTPFEPPPHVLPLTWGREVPPSTDVPLGGSSFYVANTIPIRE